MKCNHSLQFHTRNKDNTGYYCIRCNPDNIKAIKYKSMDINNKIRKENNMRTKITDCKQTTNITDDTITSIEDTINFLEYAHKENKFNSDLEGIIGVPSVKDIPYLIKKLKVCLKVLDMNKTEYYRTVENNRLKTYLKSLKNK